MAGFGFNTNNTMDFTNDMGLGFDAVFQEQQQSFGKLDEGNTSTNFSFFAADEGIDTSGSQFNLAHPSLFSMPSAESSFTMPQELAVDNTLGGGPVWDTQLASTALNDFTYTSLYQPTNSTGKRPLQLDVQDFPQSKRHESYSSAFSPFETSPPASVSMTTSSWTVDSQPTPASSSAVETGLSDEAADVCALWFSKYAILPSDRHINSLSQLTGEPSSAIRSWFGRLLKQGMAGHDSAYKSQTSFNPQQDLVLSTTPQMHTSPEATSAQDTTARTATMTSPLARGGKKGCTPTQDAELLRHDSNKVYQCTRKCGKRYTRKCDWKRNEEESYPSKSWLCSLCVSQGVNEKLKPCFRRYHFSQHFRNIHPGLDSSDYEASSLVRSDTAFPRRCGFCSHRFVSRQDRIDHIADHFKKGKCMLDWVDHDDDSQGDDNTDDDDNDHGPDGGDNPNCNSSISKRPGSGSQGDRGPRDFNNGSGESHQGSFCGFGQFQLAGSIGEEALAQISDFDANKQSPGLSWHELIDGNSSGPSSSAESSDSSTGPPYIDRSCVPGPAPNELQPGQQQKECSWNDEAAEGNQVLLARDAFSDVTSNPILPPIDIGSSQSHKTITLDDVTISNKRQRVRPDGIDKMKMVRDGVNSSYDHRGSEGTALPDYCTQKENSPTPSPGNTIHNSEFPNAVRDQELQQSDIQSSNGTQDGSRGIMSTTENLCSGVVSRARNDGCSQSSQSSLTQDNATLQSKPTTHLRSQNTVATSPLSKPTPTTIQECSRSTSRRSVGSRSASPMSDWREIISPAAVVFNKFQSFKSVKLLGTGGFSTVDEVIDRDTSLRVSRKTLKNRDSSAFEELKNEVDVLKKLRHPHIVRFLGAYQKDDKVSILISPVAETTLSIWLKKSLIEQPVGLSDTIIKMLGCLSSSIRYLHEQRPVVMHMDIKPQNVLVTFNDGKEPHVILSDFGISTSETQFGGTSKPLTRQYCAPEVSSGVARERAADIWSLGCVFLEMIAIPFSQEDRQWLDFLTEFSGREGTYYWKEVPRLHELLAGFAGRSNNVRNTDVLQTVKSMVNENPEERPTAARLTMAFTPAPCCLNWANDKAAYPGPNEELQQVEMLVRDGGVDGLTQFQQTCRGDNHTQTHDAFANAKTWLDSCVHDHEACTWHNTGTKQLPKRLVDLQPKLGESNSIRVVNSADLSDADAVDYAAISHMWRAEDLKLSSDNQGALQSNISRQLLSKTLNEAISALQRIGFRYLWADSLCVQQDSDHDKRQEISNMASIYRNAALTIVANSDSNNTYGIDLDVSVSQTRQKPTSIASDNRPAPPRTSSPTTPLNWQDTRVWTLQERLLSRRILHLTGEQMYWECNGLKASETFPRGLPSLVWEKAHTKLPTSRDPKVAQTGACLLHNSKWLKKEGDGITDSMSSQPQPALCGALDCQKDMQMLMNGSGPTRNRCSTDTGLRGTHLPENSSSSSGSVIDLSCSHCPPNISKNTAEFSSPLV